MPLWDSVKAAASAGASKAAAASKLAAAKAKLKTDMLVIDRDIVKCKQAFGVSMYDHVSPLSQSAEFYAADDKLTNILRPPLIEAQKEIQALASRRIKLKEALAAAEAKRAGAFPTKAETAGQQLMNFGKASVMHSSETKIKAEIAVVDNLIKGHKQDFGAALFVILVDAEDNDGYLPPDRQVRSIYDQTRQDIHKLQATKKKKAKELAELRGEERKTLMGDNSESQSSFNESQTSFSGGFTDTYSGTTAASNQNNQLQTGADKNNADADLLML